ncbi:MAG: DUF4179 domain-containing protein [Clostridia bacterium]|nr:DUF4179 domain-containing protein [Clostridia bacterium]
MNIIDEEDRRINAILSANIYEPDSYTSAIVTALNKRSINSFNIRKFIIALLSGLMLISGIAYAREIERFILRFFNNSKGLDTAIESGYIEEINQRVDTMSDIDIKIQSITMDENNINFNMIMSFGSSLNVADIKEIYLNEMILTDEMNNILYCNNQAIFNEYCNLNNLNLNYINFNVASNINIEDQNKDDNCIEVNVNLYSQSHLPKSKVLNIKFNVIKAVLNNNEEGFLNGAWETVINLPEKFLNREYQDYIIYESIGADIKDVTFSVYNTCSKLELYYYDEVEDDNINFFEWGTKQKNKMIENAYIENENGNVFYKEEVHSEDSVMIYFSDGSLHYKETFSLTQFDATDNLTIHFTINTVKGRKDVTLKLKR